MDCQIHLKKEASGACVNCGNFFCTACLIKVQKKNYCKACSAELLGGSQSGKEPKSYSPIVFQQQQQQALSPQTSENTGQGTGSWSALKSFMKWAIGVFLLIFAFGAASNKYYFSGFLSFLLGLYWIPPIQDALHKMAKEKYAVVIPNWARNLTSFILFMVITQAKF